MEKTNIFQQIKKVRVSESVVDQIISFVETEQLKPGDHLPSERELVSSLGVARASIREALRILEYQGIIQVQPGKGAVIIGDGKTVDEDIVRRWFNEHSNEYLELLEVREGLEVMAARLAAERASPESINQLTQILKESTTYLDTLDISKLVELDHAFHQTVAQSSGNQMLYQLIDMSIKALVGPRYSLFNIKDRARISWAHHTQIFIGIIQRDPIMAENYMKEHNFSVRKAIIELMDSDASGS